MTKKLVEHCKETTLCALLANEDMTLADLRAYVDDLTATYGDSARFHVRYDDGSGIEDVFVKVMEEETDFEYQARLSVEEATRQRLAQKAAEIEQRRLKKEAQEKKLYKELHKKYGKKA